jgi:hypothetical protein
VTLLTLGPSSKSTSLRRPVALVRLLTLLVILLVIFVALLEFVQTKSCSCCPSSYCSC